MNIQAIVRSSRPPFLILAPVCVLLGLSALYVQGVHPPAMHIALALLGGLAAHISVNTFNEYFDFHSGLDFHTRKTPFSGGSGSLPESPTASRQVLGAAIVTLLLTLLIGVYFATRVSLGIVPIGLGGLLLVVVYTKWINRHPVLCLIAPGTGFGILMVIGTQVALGGELTSTALLVAVLPFLLVNNLLLLNQYPDIEADSRVGRNHFPIAYGIGNSNHAYMVSLLLAAASIGIGTLSGLLPLMALLALLPLPLALFAWHGARQHGLAIADHPQYLAANVVVTLLSPGLLALGLFVGGTV